MSFFIICPLCIVARILFASNAGKIGESSMHNKREGAQITIEVIIMATRKSVENILAAANEKIEAARKELEQANRMGYQVDDAYTHAQLGLEEMETEISKLMNSANHQQKDELHRIHLQVSQCLNDMILDHEDLEQYDQ